MISGICRRPFGALGNSRSTPLPWGSRPRLHAGAPTEPIPRLQAGVLRSQTLRCRSSGCGRFSSPGACAQRPDAFSGRPNAFFGSRAALRLPGRLIWPSEAFSCCPVPLFALSDGNSDVPRPHLRLRAVIQASRPVILLPKASSLAHRASSWRLRAPGRFKNRLRLP
jgi:hypothetical protein